jgi:hypothetical protein
MIAAKQVLSNRQAKAVLQTETLEALVSSPWPDASGSSPSPGASTVRPDRRAVAVLRHQPLKAETCMHCKTLPGEWLLNFSVCSNELLWESLAQNRCIIDAFL